MMTRDEKSWWFITVPRGVVALAFLVGAAACWIVTGAYPQGGWVIGAAMVLVVAEVTNILDYIYAPEADVRKRFLGERTLREARALVDILPLWTIGLYVFGLLLLDGWLIAVIYLGVFLCCTLPQALCGLPEKMPMLSTALGRFVPLGISIALWFYSPIDLCYCLLFFVMSGTFVFAFWKIGAKGKN